MCGGRRGVPTTLGAAPHACWVLGRGRLLLSLHLVSAETGSATLSASRGGRRKLSFACKCGYRGSAKGLAKVSVAQGSMALSEALWASTCLTQAVWAWEGHRGLCLCQVEGAPALGESLAVSASREKLL